MDPQSPLTQPRWIAICAVVVLSLSLVSCRPGAEMILDLALSDGRTISQLGAAEDVYYWEPGMSECAYTCPDGSTPGCSCLVGP